MKINYNYTLENEFERVKDTYKRKDFFQANGYNPSFPEGLSFENFDHISAKKIIEKEFDTNKAKTVEKEIDSGWSKNSKKVLTFLEILPYKKPSNVKINFTKYGMNGSYNLPNTILINIQSTKDPFYIVIHELIHLVIEESVVEKYKLSQWEKEGLVDYLFNESSILKSLFPNLGYQKELPSQEILKKVGWQNLGL